MNKNILLVILGLAVIAYGIYSLVSNKRDESDNGLYSSQQQGEQGQNDYTQSDSIESEAVINDGSYVVNKEESQVSWQAEKVLAEHTGKVNVKSGEFMIESGKLVSGEIVIDMATISTDEEIEALENHLKSDDFFNITNYPEARLSLLSATKTTGAHDYEARAEMTIKGITNEIMLPLSLEEVDGNVVVSSNFSIDRTKWEINFRSGKFFQDLGDNMIKDEINFQVRLVGALNS